MNWLKRLFIPTDDNSFQPQALQKAAMVGMVSLVLITFVVANLQSILWLASEYLVATVLPAVVVEETNASRVSENLPSLTRSAVLDEAAKMKAEDMAKAGYFSHWSPEGVSPWHWFETAGYTYSYAGENLAVHFTDSSAVVEAWLLSPSHRKNILNEKYTEMGIGTASGKFEGYDTVFVVQLFGTPAVAIPQQDADISLGNSSASFVAEEVAAAGLPTVAGESQGEESVGMTKDGTLVLESFSATENTAAKTMPPEYVSESPSGFWQFFTSPRLILQIVYSFIGSFVLLSLLLAMALEWRRHHPVQMAYSIGLLLLMVALFQLHLSLVGGVMIA